MVRDHGSPDPSPVSPLLPTRVVDPATAPVSDRAWSWFAGIGLLAALAGGLTPPGLTGDAVYAAVGLAAAAALLVGVRRNRPALRLPWLIMVGAQLLWVTADLYYSWHDHIAGLDSYPNLGDVFYLAAYPLFAGALLVLVMHSSPHRDIGGVLDSATLTAALALLAWVVLVSPALAGADGSVTAAVVAVGYPVGDILLLAGLVRLLGARGTRVLSLRLLLAAVALLIVADVTYAAMNLHSESGTDWLNVLWLSSYVAWGTAALHPSMVRVGDPPTEDDTTVTRSRVLAFSMAMLTAPGVLGVEAALGHRLDVWPVVIGCVVMFSLAMARMSVTIQRIGEVMNQRAELQRELEHRADHDALTGLANRPQIMLLLDGALARSRRSGELISLLFVDLDGFKGVNDTFGHRAGDTVLRVVAERLQSQIRTGDTVARLGGDEFVVLLEPVDADQSALVVAQRLVQSVARPIDLGRLGTTRIGASIGVSVTRDADLSAEAFLHEADTAAYRAKTLGKGRAEVYDAALRAEVASRIDLQEAIAAAIDNDELLLHYQPIVHLATMEIVAYEALLRWDRPGHGLIAPADFIPIAETSALICDLDSWALRRACLDFAQVPTGPDGVRPLVGVNVSGRHLGRSRIVEDVAVALAQARLPARRLVVELTETVLVDDATAVRHLSVLRQGGVGINIDDFGTGYSAISKLGTLPIDTVKIDRRFVEPDSATAPILLELMVEAAHAHQLPVVVEGIEHVHQLRTLQRLGCEGAQGYLLGRPGPLAEVLARGVPLAARALIAHPE